MSEKDTECLSDEKPLHVSFHDRKKLQRSFLESVVDSKYFCSDKGMNYLHCRKTTICEFHSLL